MKNEFLFFGIGMFKLLYNDRKYEYICMYVLVIAHFEKSTLVTNSTK